jgi:hypothetical protein
MLLWDDENVGGRLRIDIPERDAMIALRQDSDRNLLPDDPAEQTIVSH